MTLELKLILGFLFHLIGDYVTQNHWMAINKTKKISVASLHAFIYCLPFAFLPISMNAFAVIFISHIYIDRHRLAQYWIKFVNWNWRSKNHGYPYDTPVWLSTWLLFIIDNIFHITINTLAICFL